jgi:anti-sigma-K factor RskA
MTGLRPDCQTIGDLHGVYALGALDAAEAQRVAAHLAACPRCSQEVDALRQTIGLLAAAGAGEAPTGLWEAIGARIEGSPPAGDSRPPVPALLGRTRRKPGWRRPSRWLGAAAGAAAAAAAVIIASGTIQIAHLEHRVSQLTAAAGQSGGFQGAAAALIDPSARRLLLTSTRPETKPLGELVILPSGSAYLIASGMAPLPATSTYQLWAVIDGRAISVGVLGAYLGDVAFSVDPAVPAAAYLLTVEPAGGVVTPTASPIAQARV